MKYTQEELIIIKKVFIEAVTLRYLKNLDGKLYLAEDDHARKMKRIYHKMKGEPVA